MSAVDPTLRRTIAAGLDYILSRQADDGSWADWALPAGRSAPWTTAYIGFKLRSLPPDLMARAEPHLAEAARWQSDHIFPDGGWGYNALVGSDADSTAHAIQFLASAAQPAAQAAYARLATFQNEDGGFATYLREGPVHSWNASHPDVTPAALRALLTHPAPDREAIRRGTEYVLRQGTPAGLWNSFWWRSCLYSTEANLALLDTVGIEVPSVAGLAAIVPCNAFEAALLVSSLLYTNRHGAKATVRNLARQLIREQRPDGGWDSAPILRITRRDCYEPWVYPDAGPVYADPERLFTTATVVHALAKVELLASGGYHPAQPWTPARSLQPPTGRRQGSSFR